MRLPYFMVQELLRESDFTKKEFWKSITIFAINGFFLNFGEKSTFAIACSVQTKHWNIKVLNKKSAKDYGLSAKRMKS